MYPSFPIIPLDYETSLVLKLRAAYVAYLASFRIDSCRENNVYALYGGI